MKWCGEKGIRIPDGEFYVITKPYGSYFHKIFPPCLSGTTIHSRTAEADIIEGEELYLRDYEREQISYHPTTRDLVWPID